MKPLVQHGCNIWFYQVGTRFTFRHVRDNVVGYVRAETNAEYRRQIAKWTKETMIRRHEAAHVTDGRGFGYDNVCSTCGREILPGKQRCSLDGYAERLVNMAQAAVIRRIFTLCSESVGYTKIAKQLNCERGACAEANMGGTARPESLEHPSDVEA